MTLDLLCLLWALLGIALPLLLVWHLLYRCGGDTESTWGPCRNRPERGRRRCHLHSEQLLSKADLAAALLLLLTAASAYLWWTSCLAAAA